MAIKKEVLDELLAGAEGKGVFGKDGLFDDLKKALDERNRFLFALAAYNAGPGNLRKFRKKAVEMGLNPNLWFGNVENAAAEIVGRETIQYVSNIYMYYVAYTLLLEAREGNAAAKAKAGSDLPQ